MHEVRFHGRGGQGAVTSAELLAQAAIDEGKSAQAFPSFGPERRGAPVMAFARVADRPIRNRTVIQEPTAVLVLDPALPGLVKVDDGLVADGVVILNTSRSADEVRKDFGIVAKLALVDANRIAREVIGRVITNTTMLGALVRAVGLVEASSLEKQFESRFGRLAAKNIQAFQRAQQEVVLVDAV
ncbi:MAG: 2-oxoacid:acceptor oxidoreductase family protein [Deltaproteobacteria bacterium]|nr:2-oxoacid:acceptor oxidoreductase family protein [Deltaproteobacteria bacterium]